MTQTKTAIVADGSAEIRRMQRDVLRSLGFLTIEAQDGFHLLDRLRKVRPSVVVVDLGLSGLDGTEVLHFIRRNEDWMDLPVVVTSSQTNPGTRRLVRQSGGTAFLVKPGTPEALKEVVAALLLPDPPAVYLEEDPGDRSGFNLPAV